MGPGSLPPIQGLGDPAALCWAGSLLLSLPQCPQIRWERIRVRASRPEPRVPSFLSPVSSRRGHGDPGEEAVLAASPGLPLCRGHWPLVAQRKARHSQTWLNTAMSTPKGEMLPARRRRLFVWKGSCLCPLEEGASPPAVSPDCDGGRLGGLSSRTV